MNAERDNNADEKVEIVPTVLADNNVFSPAFISLMDPAFRSAPVTVPPADIIDNTG
jgi:hypothetical protein